MVGAVVVLVVGLVLTLHFVLLTAQRSFDHLARMVDISEGGGHFKLDMAVLVILSCVMSISGAFGYVAIHKESPKSLASYLLLTSALAVFYLWVFGYGMTLETALEPVLQRHVSEFCNGSTHELYQHVLGCNYSEGFLANRGKKLETARGICSLGCLERVEVLHRLGGCPFLEDLCENFVYTDEGIGRCLVESPQGPVTAPTLVSHGVPHHTILLNATQHGATEVQEPGGDTVAVSQGAVASEHCCKRACSITRHCAGFSFDYDESTCYLVSAHEPPASELNPLSLCSEYKWRASDEKLLPGLDNEHLSVVAVDGKVGSKCFKKELILKMVQAISQNGVWLAAGSMVALISLMAATTCACLLQYSMITRRQGRKNGLALLGKMLCPCLESPPRSRAKGIQLQSLSSSSDSEDGGRFVHGK